MGWGSAVDQSAKRIQKRQGVPTMSGLQQKTSEEIRTMLEQGESQSLEQSYKAVVDDPENPDMTEAIQQAVAKKNKGGRPKSANPKVFTGIRLDPDIIERFKAEGKGWQTRINAVLREWVDTHPARWCMLGCLCVKVRFAPPRMTPCGPYGRVVDFNDFFDFWGW